MSATPVAGRQLPSRAEFENAACRSTGLEDFGDPYFRDGLDALLDSLGQEVRLKFLGAMMLKRAISTALEQRLLVQDIKKRDPARLAGDILPPRTTRKQVFEHQV